MDLLVKDIVKIWNNGDASLVAGKEGILRKVEVFDMMECTSQHILDTKL